MATLVLTAVGSAIGGPIGGAIGAAIGQQIDNAIFAPKPREGARLKELAIQTSSYGTAIPAVFGRMRIAGTVFWATDLIERRAKSGGRKGRPSTINYSYSVSMAVALSSRPIQRVGRIWADGNLLRGDAGVLKTDTQLRIYTGEADQPLDPLIASAEPVGRCPAYRGIAYAVFEEFQLADYGNRIPSLTFEIFERESEVPVSEIFSVATQNGVHGSSSAKLDGFALASANAADALGSLLAVLPIELGSRQGALVLRDPASASDAVVGIEPVELIDRKQLERPKQALEPTTQLPHSLTLRYYDGERDYQASLQRSERGVVTRNAVQFELPAVLSADNAKTIAEQRHLRFHIDRQSWQGTASLDEFELLPGDWFEDANGRKWRAESIEYSLGSMQIVARAPTQALKLLARSVAPGRSIPSPDKSIGETRLQLVELPASALENASKPVIAAFAAGTGEGWKRAALSLQSGDALIDVGTTAAPATLGATLDILPPHSPMLMDESTILRVVLANGAMDIAERAGSPLDIDAPHCWVGGKFMRFGQCTALGNGMYRLSHFQRGCFRPDFSIAPEPVGSPFVLIEPDSARIIDDPIFAKDELVIVSALGLADVEPVTSSCSVEALAITPWVPVHGYFEQSRDGAVSLQWIRRSRIDAGWRDALDQIMAEQQEQYRVSLIANGQSVAEYTVFENSLSFNAASWTALQLLNAAEVVAQIREVGRFAQSEPLEILVSS